MPAYDDVSHPEDRQCVLYRRRLAAVDSPVRRDDVARVSHDEKLAGPGLREQIWVDARVGASDEERFGRLPTRESSEELLVGTKDFLVETVDAFDELVHGVPPRGIGSEDRWMGSARVTREPVTAEAVYERS
jgi:hypothetical protein